MNLKNIIRSLAPPILVDTYHKLTRTTIWEGVYSDFKEVKVDGEDLNGDIWADIVDRETRELEAEITKGGTIPALLKGDNSLLPLLVSIVSNRNGIRILDFGGGAGVDYLHLKGALNRMENIECHVVESDKICQRGRVIHQNDPRIIFHTSLPEHVSAFDIVHMDSVLQYIEDYPSLLRVLCGYEPQFFLFVRLSAGKMLTYVTKQKNVSGISSPYRFINVDELIGVMSECGYAVAFRSAGDIEHDQDNFPLKYRMGHTCNLLFIRSNSAAEENASR